MLLNNYGTIKQTGAKKEARERKFLKDQKSSYYKTLLSFKFEANV